MKLKEFRYTNSAGAVKDYELLVLKDGDTYLEGISLVGLAEDRRLALINIQARYENELKEFMEFYKKFTKASIIE